MVSIGKCPLFYLLSVQHQDAVNDGSSHLHLGDLTLSSPILVVKEAGLEVAPSRQASAPSKLAEWSVAAAGKLQRCDRFRNTLS